MGARRPSAAIVAAVMAMGGGAAQAAVAPGAPGGAGTWAYAGKTGIGTAYAPYGPGRARSRVWFSIARGRLTEVMWGLIHEAQLREIKLALVGEGFTAFPSDAGASRTEYLVADAQGRPRALAYRLVATDPARRFKVETQVFADPDADAVVVRYIVRSHGGALTPYLLADPQMAGTGPGDRAEAARGALHAWQGDAHLVIVAARPFEAASVGFVGASDGETQLKRDGRLTPYDTTGERPGDVALSARLAPTPAGGERVYDIVLGFGATEAQAQAAAAGSLRRGHDAVLAAYVGGEGRHAGWADYLAGLSELPRVAKEAEDGGRLAYASAMVLKAQEDKTHPGALIASLSNPWGETVAASTPQTGYKAVWPRDFYQVASALMALGDRATPVRALDYLHTVQVTPTTPGNHGASGWFLQKTHVDGTPEWTSVQLDQTAMPIMLADKLLRAGWITPAHATALYRASLKPAADFLVAGGRVDFRLATPNEGTVTPPKTQTERWEEQPGYSPSTTAAEITGLVAAADLAEGAGDRASAARYRAAADRYAAGVESTSFTTDGAWGGHRYFVRISPDGRPDGHALVDGRNGKAAVTQDRMVDAGFLELVRYGVRRADAPSILSSLPVIDDVDLPADARIHYLFHVPGEPGAYPGWRRYGWDGYGEDTTTGRGFGGVTPEGRDSPDQRGRVWPIFTGERGTYEVARATLGGALAPADQRRIRDTYVRGMELFANDGLMLPEQVYDGVGASGGTERPGQGTGSATPLAWSHAEYLKLLRSLADGRVWDRYEAVAQRYAR